MGRGYRFSFPPYPIGWFQVAYANELEPGQVMPLEYFGKDLVLFRTQGGEAVLMDAFCPHLGAHLGYGGKVEGEEIRCPFHAWKFDSAGKCSEIPYGKKIPPGATLGKWVLREVNGLLMAWHHPDAAPPTYEIPVIPEYGDEGWTEYIMRRWKVRTRNQEMAENSVDTAHFHYLHGTHNMPTATLEPEGHILKVVSDTVMKTPGGLVNGEIQVEMHGFGFSLTRFVGLVETLIVNSVTAIDEEYVDVRFAFTVKKFGGVDVTRGIGKAFVREITRQLEQDIPIWENKKHIKPPILSDGDGPIGKYRKWCKQFYADPNAIP